MTDKATADILSKVKKLMALGASPSEAEAASALQKARELLARYGLSMADLDTHHPEVVEGLLIEKKRLRGWESHLIHIITSCTFTTALHVQRNGTGQVLLIGRELNTLAAAELFAYLHNVVLKLGRAFSNEVGHLESFKRGVVQRTGERLLESAAGKEKSGGPWAGVSRNQAAPSSNAESGSLDQALMVQMEQTAGRENKAYISEKYGKTGTKRTASRVDAHSYHKGRSAGDSVSLNRQVQ